MNRRRSARTAAVGVGEGKKKRSQSLPAVQACPRSGAQRSNSMPTRLRSIMKVSTLDESLHSTYGSNSSMDSSERSIAFGDLQIREYDRTVGDNPSCSTGPPIGISWDYNPNTIVVNVEEYEEMRPPRRSNAEMILPRQLRVDMLKKEWDVSQIQIAAAIRDNVRVKNQRRCTVSNLDKAPRMEELMESARRKVKRTVLFRKRTKDQVKELNEQADKAQRQLLHLVLEEQMAD